MAKKPPRSKSRTFRAGEEKTRRSAVARAGRRDGDNAAAKRGTVKPETPAVRFPAMLGRNPRETPSAASSAVAATRRRPIGPRQVEGRWPVMLETAGWSDFALLDMGDGEKLERYGPYTIRRPEAQAMGARQLPAARWEGADATFTGDMEEEGSGRWRFARDLPDAWPMSVNDVNFLGRFMSFRHVGVFPEQIAHWNWAGDQIRAADRPLKVLNLFGYTGIASLLAASAGAEVTHVDASKKAIGWARENQALSEMNDLPIRWICDDAMKFIAREIRRGNRYDCIVLDPPKYGRGPKGEVWDLFRDLPAALDMARLILSDKPVFVILSVYAIRASFLSNHELMMDVFRDRAGTLESGELVIREAGDTGRTLSTSLFSRWSAP